MAMELRRVVVTGVGAVTPLGTGVENVWDRLLKSESGAAGIQSFDTDDLSVKIACQVPIGDSASGAFNPDDHVSPKDQRKMDDLSSLRSGRRQKRSRIPAGNWIATKMPTAPV